MKIAFYKGRYGNYLDKIICLGTLSKYSHCEIVFSDGICASSSYRDGGVRFKYINLNDGKWDVYDLDNSQESEAAIHLFFECHNGNRYDTFGALLSVFGLSSNVKDKQFCSEICAMALGVGKVLTPGGLFKLLKKIKKI